MPDSLPLGSMLKTFLQGLLPAWPLGLLLLGILLLKALLSLLEKQRLARSGIADIDTMDGRTFERYLEVLFQRQGYRVERTPYIGDWGADLVLAKDVVKTVVQAKRYKGKVGVKAVQEAVAAKGKYGCQAAMVVTNSNYTQQAISLAKANQVTLWDRAKLLDALPGLLPAVPCAPSAESDASPSACAICGKPVSEKVLLFCRTHPERFAGQILCYDHQRKG